MKGSIKLVVAIAYAPPRAQVLTALHKDGKQRNLHQALRSDFRALGGIPLPKAKSIAFGLRDEIGFITCSWAYSKQTADNICFKIVEAKQDVMVDLCIVTIAYRLVVSGKVEMPESAFGTHGQTINSRLPYRVDLTGLTEMMEIAPPAVTYTITTRSPTTSRSKVEIQAPTPTKSAFSAERTSLPTAPSTAATVAESEYREPLGTLRERPIIVEDETPTFTTRYTPLATLSSSKVATGANSILPNKGNVKGHRSEPVPSVHPLPPKPMPRSDSPLPDIATGDLVNIFHHVPPRHASCVGRPQAQAIPASVNGEPNGTRAHDALIPGSHHVTTRSPDDSDPSGRPTKRRRIFTDDPPRADPSDGTRDFAMVPPLTKKQKRRQQKQLLTQLNAHPVISVEKGDGKGASASSIENPDVTTYVEEPMAEPVSEKGSRASSNEVDRMVLDASPAPPDRDEPSECGGDGDGALRAELMRLQAQLAALEDRCTDLEAECAVLDTEAHEKGELADRGQETKLDQDHAQEVAEDLKAEKRAHAETQDLLDQAAQSQEALDDDMGEMAMALQELGNENNALVRVLEGAVERARRMVPGQPDDSSLENPTGEQSSPRWWSGLVSRSFDSLQDHLRDVKDALAQRARENEDLLRRLREAEAAFDDELRAKETARTDAEESAGHAKESLWRMETAERALQLESVRRLEAEAALQKERERRLLAESSLGDVIAESASPFIVPALLDAFLDLTRMTSQAMTQAGGG
ncbi:hypothetical protein PUNSTDRAFT_55442 [Punctularia strigosozonata HHB-11173 SS5]|uniref:Uncharacterized protein n=1 Tax=Punctularia strigosozonata (strain HHB-11173) TaxID=741275 RepID=R7S315_PUNST|nr:uncharacterized protein PUNSTDRAFT_55442 [Punctularia strigosozonata HHB-11173 SS5]EIN04765.1 hypothetical protein PUNSTDRAFT_55442 [Punctularia strigosozonata HHB-11173 SS5]